ncbi:MAG: YmfQ family protein [Eubacterium sp.]|nr:YmfQ family protein [Eubacterium sp.]
MLNFNNSRTIDLTDYLPDVLKNVTEMQAVMKAETPIVQAIWNACEDCMNDQFISEATENGIARREKMLDITPYATDTLEDRRFRLLSRYNENTPYTRKNLVNMLETLCGVDGYELTILTSEFTVHVKVALTVKKQFDSVSELLERILPYNMAFSVELLYNTWEKLKPFTWADVHTLTWRELKEEVLPDGDIYG